MLAEVWSPNKFFSGRENVDILGRKIQENRRFRIPEDA